LHEVDLVGIDVEGDVREQLVIEPLSLVRFGQVIDPGEIMLVNALGWVGRDLLD